MITKLFYSMIDLLCQIKVSLLTSKNCLKFLFFFNFSISRLLQIFWSKISNSRFFGKPCFIEEVIYDSKHQQRLTLDLFLFSASIFLASSSVTSTILLELSSCSRLRFSCSFFWIKNKLRKINNCFKSVRLLNNN